MQGALGGVAGFQLPVAVAEMLVSVREPLIGADCRPKVMRRVPCAALVNGEANRGSVLCAAG